jgi:hypothetical protein
MWVTFPQADSALVVYVQFFFQASEQDQGVELGFNLGVNFSVLFALAHRVGSPARSKVSISCLLIYIFMQH